MPAGVVIQTVKLPWMRFEGNNSGVIDATAAAADGVLLVTERHLDFVKNLDNVAYKFLPDSINSVEVRFMMSTNGHDATIDVWAGRRRSDVTEEGTDISLCRVCTLGIECGTQDYPGSSTLHFIDEITLSNNTSQWPKTVSVIQSSNDSELMARFVGDWCGYDLIVLHSHTTCSSDVTPEISGF